MQCYPKYQSIVMKTFENGNQNTLYANKDNHGAITFDFNCTDEK